MLKLNVKNRKTQAENSYQFKKNVVVIGRGRQCDVVLESDTVSRQHAQIHVGQGELFLEDLGSGNGTFVNGKAIPPKQKIPLKSGDGLRIEDFEIQWQLDNPLPEFEQTSPLNSTDPDILEIKMIKKVIGALSHSKKPQLIVVSEPFAGKTLSLEDTDKTFTIGREPDCELILDSPILSRKHAQIYAKWGTFVIKDLQSKNGTFVNNEPVTGETSLKDQDQIQFGTLQAVFHQPDSLNFSEIEKSLHAEKPQPQVEESQSLAAKKTAEPTPPAPPAKDPTPPPAEPPKPAAPAPQTKTESGEDILKTLPDENPAEQDAGKPKGSMLRRFSALEWSLLIFAVIVIAAVIAGIVILL